MANETQTVEVELIVPPDFSTSGEGRLRFLVEDVSEADAPARTIAHEIFETTIEPGKHLSATLDIPLNAIDPRRSYNFRAHVSMNREDSVQVGDLITTQSAPVLTQGPAARIVLPLREVR